MCKGGTDNQEHNMFLIWGAEILYALHQQALEGFTFLIENNTKIPDVCNTYAYYQLNDLAIHDAVVSHALEYIFL